MKHHINDRNLSIFNSSAKLLLISSIQLTEAYVMRIKSFESSTSKGSHYSKLEVRNL